MVDLQYRKRYSVSCCRVIRGLSEWGLLYLPIKIEHCVISNNKYTNTIGSAHNPGVVNILVYIALTFTSETYNLNLQQMFHRFF